MYPTYGIVDVANLAVLGVWELLAVTVFAIGRSLINFWRDN